MILIQRLGDLTKVVRISEPRRWMVASQNFPFQTAEQRRERAMRRRCMLEAENADKVLLGELYEDQE